MALVEEHLISSGQLEVWEFSPRLPALEPALFVNELTAALLDEIGGESSDLQDALLRHRGDPTNGVPTVLFLDWTQAPDSPSVSTLGAWFSLSHVLVEACPEDCAVVNYIGLTIPIAQWGDLQQTVSTLHARSEPHPEARLVLCPALAPMGKQELLQFLLHRRNFPRMRGFEIARLLLEETDGEMEAILHWLEAGEQVGWDAVATGLREGAGNPIGT